MATQEIAVGQLQRDLARVSCCNCDAAVREAPEHQVWYIFNGRQIVCTKCAEAHGIARPLRCEVTGSIAMSNRARESDKSPAKSIAR